MTNVRYVLSVSEQSHPVSEKKINGVEVVLCYCKLFPLIDFSLTCFPPIYVRCKVVACWKTRSLEWGWCFTNFFQLLLMVSTGEFIKSSRHTNLWSVTLHTFPVNKVLRKLRSMLYVRNYFPCCHAQVLWSTFNWILPRRQVTTWLVNTADEQLKIIAKISDTKNERRLNTRFLL